MFLLKVICLSLDPEIIKKDYLKKGDIDLVKRRIKKDEKIL